MIYYLIKNISGENQWNNLFYSYFPTLIIFLLYYFNKKKTNETKKEKNKDQKLIYGVIFFNIVVGLAGYFLRFYTIKKLPTKIYSVLSYFGIIMSYVYGYLFDGNKISFQQIIGTLLIIYSNYLFL